MSKGAIQTLRLGTRGSALALWQANWVKSEIERLTGTPVELVQIKTTGDRIVDTPLAAIGGKGLFTKELDEALIDNRIDLAAHSLKDVPFELPPGLVIAAVPPREVPWDAFISSGPRLNEMPSGAAIGTGSLRRGVQLLRRFPSLRVVPMRGNVDTRLRKLDAHEYDGIILAAAGLRRLGHAARIVETLDEQIMLPAIGQGALAVVCRAGDGGVLELLTKLEHTETRLAVTAERALLLALEGSCQIPIAGLARVSGTRMHIKSLIANPSGTTVVEDDIQGLIDQSTERAFALGTELAARLMRKGADRILDEIRRDATSR